MRCSRRGDKPTHKVTALRTLVFPGPSIKLPPVATPPLGAKLTITREQDRFAVSPVGFLPLSHVAPLDHRETDFVAVAERFARNAVSVGRQDQLWARLLGTGAGVAQCLRHPLPARQRHAGKRARQASRTDSPPRRGDLVFWKGHVAIVRDETTIVHANAFHMMVAVEPIAEAIARISAAGSEVTSVKRL